jgi:hypothetical protein
LFLGERQFELGIKNRLPQGKVMLPKEGGMTDLDKVVMP